VDGFQDATEICWQQQQQQQQTAVVARAAATAASLWLPACHHGDDHDPLSKPLEFFFL